MIDIFCEHCRLTFHISTVQWTSVNMETKWSLKKNITRFQSELFICSQAANKCVLRLKGMSHKYKRNSWVIKHTSKQLYVNRNTIRLSFIKKMPNIKVYMASQDFKNNVYEMCLFSCSVIHSLSYLFWHAHTHTHTNIQIVTQTCPSLHVRNLCDSPFYINLNWT